MRVGFGYDVHKLTEGRKCIICGVDVPHDRGLLGHSDADVAIHALCDALLGAAALGDIGTHFPDSDDKYKGISSIVLLRETVSLLRKNGYSIGNIDATIIAQAPKLAPYIPSIREKLAEEMRIGVECVSVKAKTNEKMGFTGRGEGIEVNAVALICTEEQNN